MKILTIKVNGKTFTTGKITAFLSKESLKIQKESLALAKKAQELQKDTENIEAVDELLTALMEIKERKTWLICEAYGKEFSTDDLEQSLSDDEIDTEVSKIISGIYGVVSKN